MFLIRDTLMSFSMIFQLISMHGLDVTCLPDLLIFVLSLKLNYFVHFLNNLAEKNSVLHYRKTFVKYTKLCLQKCKFKDHDVVWFIILITAMWRNF